MSFYVIAKLPFGKAYLFPLTLEKVNQILLFTVVTFHFFLFSNALNFDDFGCDLYLMLNLFEYLTERI